MSTPIEPATTTATTAAPVRPRLTGGQRASAILAGIAGHTVFAIGWFGFGFVLVGALFSALIGGLLRSVLGSADSQAVAQILERAGAIVWILLLVFTVGAVAFMVLGVIISAAILRRGEVHRPWGTTWGAVVVAALIDIPAFWIVVSISVAVADGGASMVVLPTVLALVLVVATGALVWWWIAHANRPKAAPTPAGSALDARDDAGEALEPLAEPAGALGEEIAGDHPRA